MRKIWQQDVLRYLTNRRQKPGVEDPGLPFGLHLPLKNVRLDLRLGGDDAKLSNFISRKKNHAYKIGFNAEEIFDKLIQPLIDENRIRPDDALRNFHEFLWAEDIEDTWQDILDYRECIIAALTEGLQRHFPIELEDNRLPALHSQRYPANAQFTGREQSLALLRAALESQGSVILAGLGGMGKTVLAEEYARRQANRYRSRQTIAAEPGFTSFKDLLLAVEFDNLELDADLSQEEALNRRMDLLCRLDDSALLIFDNVDQDLEDYGLFRRLLRDSGAHIIVTTRRQQAFPEGTRVPVGALSPADQLVLLSRSMERPIRPDEEEAAVDICRRIDGHTLAIQLIGRAIRRENLSGTEMLTKLSGLSGFPAFDAEVQVHKDDFNKEQQILRFIQEFLFDLEPLPPDAQDMLRFLTLVPLEGTSRSLLTGEVFALSEKVLSDLEERSWVISDAGLTRLHPVIREAVLAELTVDTNTCTPFLVALDQVLGEPEVSPELPALLRLAANAVDMLYISDPLRRLLSSERMNPVFEEVYSAASSLGLWDRWQEMLTEQSADEELTQAGADTLRMYATFCEYMGILDRARAASGEPAAEPFLDMDRLLEGVASGGETDRLGAVIQTLLDQVYALDPELLDEETLAAFADDPAGLLQLVTSTLGAELTDYLQDSGLAISEGSDPDAVPSLFTLLCPEDLQLLESVSQPVYEAFLVTALEAFSVGTALLPYVASSSVFALTQLFVLLHMSSAQLHTFAEIAAKRGWLFPQITYLPKGLPQDGALHYEESLWGRPSATITYENDKTCLIVTMSRPNRQDSMDEFDLWEAEEVEHTDERIIRVRVAPGRGRTDVQADLGPWCVRIQGLQGVNQKEAVRIARGLRLPAGPQGIHAALADPAG